MMLCYLGVTLTVSVAADFNYSSWERDPEFILLILIVWSFFQWSIIHLRRDKIKMLSYQLQFRHQGLASELILHHRSHPVT